LPYEWVEHVGELELRVRAADERTVFADALRALGELLRDEDHERTGDLEALEVVVEPVEDGWQAVAVLDV
jgi:hypothetical protein